MEFFVYDSFFLQWKFELHIMHVTHIHYLKNYEK